jgi:hypothetical protein
MVKRLLLVSLASVVGGVVFVAPALGAGSAPGWQVFGRFSPTVLPPGGDGLLRLYVYNIGSATPTGAGPVLIDRLPAGLEAISEVTVPDVEPERESAGCTGTTEVKCQLPAIAPLLEPTEVLIPVHVPASIPDGLKAVDTISVTGGGALDMTNDQVAVSFGSTPAGLGLANFDGWASDSDGTIDTQAGSHPYELTIVYAPNVTGFGKFQEVSTGGEARALNTNLPPGLIGEPSAVPQCTRQQFDGEECPPESQVGMDYATTGGFANISAGFDVFNMVPPPGVAAEFAFDFAGISIFLDATVRSGGDNGITVHVHPVPQRQILFNTITIWGVPGEHERLGIPAEPTGAKPLLSLPTSCGGQQPMFSLEELGTWQEEAATPPPLSFPFHTNNGTPSGFTGCERLVHFTPTASIAPDTSQGDTPAGLTTTVRVPQGLNPEGLATSGLKNTTVVLPEGIAINPGQATGLVACQLWQENVGGPDAEKESEDGPPSCPAASKVGEDEISTPLLPDRLKGSVYILQSNPPSLQLLVAASGDGVNLKLIGTVHLNETTGQLVATFDETPDAPVNEFKLSFSGGAQAALVTPAYCRVYTTNTDFTPWSGLEDALVEGNFTINSGPNGSPCENPLPFTPSMTAGATTDQAGGYTGFSILLQRPDGQQRVSSLAFKAPEGLLGMLSKVPLCEEPQAAQGTCPASSQIGHTVVGAGPGPYPLFIPQAGAPPAPIYLTGPYKGAPFGLSIVVPIVAGPFNLGTEVVRARIEVDPLTSQIIVATDPLPTIVKGIPADLRSINAVIDRPEFMFNPTNCNPASFSGTATSTEGATAALSSPFQVGSCRSLTFKPGFDVATSAKTSRVDGASLAVKLSLPDDGGLSATANVERVKVSLPKRLPTPLKTLQRACLERTFAANPAGCPVASQVGQVKVSTPVLPGGLSGTAYFVSHGGAKYPELIMVLVGENGVTVQVHGETFISRAGITTATFAAVPDVPFSSFELLLPKRVYPALTANGNLCKGGLAMPTEMVAQNGLVIKQNTKIAVTGCPQAKKLGHKRKQTKRRSGRRRG